MDCQWDNLTWIRKPVKLYSWLSVQFQLFDAHSRVVNVHTAHMCTYTMAGRGN